MQLQQNDDWQTKARGTLEEEYKLYLDLSDDGKGKDICTGEWLKTFDEWLNS